uniref:Mediator complex subunit 15 KIX domain-containing protein n=1 Tax=Brassica oleracea var. oleracea TaxID=109376 RepID=A0A0D3CAL4_BRAOL
MSSSSNDEVYEVFEEMVDQQIDDFIDSVLTKEPKRRAYIERDREQGHNQLWQDYFSENPTYTHDMFRRRFRMNKSLFLRIVERLGNEIPYFQQRRNGHGRNGLSTLQKCSSAIRSLAYGQAGDVNDEYLRLAASTAILCLENFAEAIIQLFGDEYLRRPTTEDLQRLLDVGEARGFPGMIGSIDCMHWEWKNCPTAWKGTLNDINVLDRSPVFDDILQGRAPKVKFKVNNHTYRMTYYLTDGIYPNWATFIQSIPLPQGPKAQKFAEKQESVRKDVERAFGVLQSRFAIVKNPALKWDNEKIGKIMRTCVILHNMIVEDERHRYTLADTSEFESGESSRSAKEHLMDNNNWRLSIPNGESAAMNNGEWRKQLPPDSRQKIVNKIMETLSRHLPNSGPEGIIDLRRIAARFEEKIFSCAVNQTDYLRKISMKMLTMETKSQNAAGSSSTTPDANNTTSMDSIPNNQGQLLPGTLPNNQSQAPQPLMSQTIQSNTASGITGSTGLPSSMPPVSSIANNSVVNQNSSMQNVAGLLQDSSGQHGVSSNMLSGSQRQMLGRPPHTLSSQQQQPQGAQYLYQQQQLLRQNFQAGNVPNPNSLLPTHIQQQQQQNVLQPNQMHSSQQPASTTSATQPSAVSSAPIQGLHTNQQSSPQLSSQQTTSQTILRQQQSSLLRQHPQSQQSSGIHQQQTSLPQQSISPQQQAQMMRQQAASGSGIQQKQMMGQHVLGDMQHQHQQRLLNQQNNVMNMQQQQKQHPPAQQQLMSQQNSLQATTQQPLGTQSNVAGLQQPQQQLLSSQVGNSSLQTNQQSLHMLSQPTAALQRTHQAGHGLYPSQGQQSQNQPAQQQMVPLQSHRQQLQQPNLVQQDVQQRLLSSGQVAGSLLPPQNVVDQQRQLYQSQRTLLEMPSSSLDSTAQTESGNAVDWQEEVFQKIKTMKDAYLPDITEIYQRVIAKLQQMDSLPQQQRSEQFEKLKQFKTMLERMMQFLSVSKSSIMPPLKNKVAIYEKQIIDFVTAHRPRKPVQQGQLPQSQMQPMQQQSSQNGNHSHDGQANPQMQSMSMPRAQQSSLEIVQNNVLSSRPGASAPQQNIHSSVPASSLESGQGNALNNGQQVAMRSIQQNTYQQVNNTSASAQSGLSTLQPNVNQTQLSSGLLQQQKDQQMTQQQQLKQQFQQRQMQQQQQQLLQKQRLMQQHQEQLQARQQVAQNDLKPGSQLPVTSPQLLPGSSPQMTQQHSSPQIDQKNMMSSVNKMGTPVQPANSPFVVPSPATPVAPSPMQVDSEKPSGASSLSMGNTARQQATGVQGVVQSIAFGTPGISASPLLQEFTSPEGNNLNPLTSTFGKPSATELPIERLIRAVKSISPQSLSSAVSDIGSVVSMVDRIAGSAPGNGSRASVGEDFVAKTKCRLQARNFMAQEGMTPTKKMKRHATAMPLSVYSLGGSVGDNCKQFACSETSDLESTATSVGKKARTETEHALLEEIKEINQRLIDTVVEISDEEDATDSSEGATASKGCEGTTVRFSFIAVSLSPALKAHFSLTQMSPIQPLRLLVPCSYPNGSPSLLDKLPVETSKENEDLSSKAVARFNILLRSLSQPMSLKDIATTWDACARTVICEYAQQFGGGTFSSKYSTWEKFVAAS